MRRLALSVAMGAVGLASLAASGLGAPSPTGVFRYSLDVDIDYVDPALAYYLPTWEIEYATCSMLVNYPDAPAPRGSRLVPEVARGFPQVSKDGTVYTFRLNKTYRFSNGAPITAASFAAAINRNLNRRMASPAQPFLEDVVGAEAVIQGRATKAAGVEVLSRYRLRITLAERAPDLLARLAMPFFCAIPPKLPINPDGISAPVVGSGPYYIAEWQRNRRIVLRRNRFYRGPRPQTLAAVVYDIGLPTASIKLRIDRGETDHGPVPPVAHAELGLQYGVRRSSPGRYFVNPGGTLRYLVLNHERELFGKPGGGRGADVGNVPLKRAVNFAIDRTAMLGQRGAYAGSFTDQYLPSTIFGARNEAIYPTLPDLSRARALARGNTRGGRARLYAGNRAPAPQIAQIVDANLAQIGLDVEILLQPRCCFWHPGTRGEPFDIFLAEWHADYFDPFDYLFLLDGRTIRAANNTNLSYFDSREYNAKLARAASLTGQARYKAFGALDVDLARNAAPLASYAVDNDRRYFSARVRRFFSHPVYSLDLASMKVE
jgi:ABC-type oligopeptide transport system substrate-binding subunit